MTAAVVVITKDQALTTTFFSMAVESFVIITQWTMLVANTVELVTVTVLPAAAIFTLPVGLLIV